MNHSELNLSADQFTDVVPELSDGYDLLGQQNVPGAEPSLSLNPDQESQGLVNDWLRRRPAREPSTILDSRVTEESLETSRRSRRVRQPNNSGERKVGSSGKDNLKADTGDRLYGLGGKDRLTAHKGGGKNRLYGGPGADTLLAGQRDRLYGNGGKDFLSGLKGDGKNVLRGGADHDRLLANRRDTLRGDGGNDYLDASRGKGKNRLKGGKGKDLLIAGFKDRLHGDRGADILWAGKGKNRLTGGKGQDQFWIVDGRLPQHRNVIKDFNIGADFLGISVSNDIRRFSDLGLIQQGTHTLIQFEGQDIALLKNVQATALNASMTSA